MGIQDLLHESQAIWGQKQMSLEEIVVALGVVYGDLCRQARAVQEGNAPNAQELQKELGNVIFSVIRWCSDLGYDPAACIAAAKSAQAAYAARLK